MSVSLALWLIFSHPLCAFPSTSLLLTLHWLPCHIIAYVSLGNFSASWSLSFFISKMGLMICLNEFLCCRVHAQCSIKMAQISSSPLRHCFFLEDNSQSWLITGDSSWMHKDTLNTSHNLRWKKEETTWRIKEKEPTHTQRGTANHELDSAFETFHFASWDYNSKRVPIFVLKPYSWTCCSAVMMES